MFYLIAAFWVIGCLFVCLIKHAKAPHLIISCPCLAVAAILASIFLFIAEMNVLAYLILGIGLFISLIILLAGLSKRLDAEEQS
jgi:uncharacterized membrane protein YccC